MVEIPLKHVIWGRRKLAGLWLADKASCVNYVLSPFQTTKVIASSLMGKTNVSQLWDYNLVSIDHLVLIDRWSAWVHSLDCLFVIYKHFDFEDFLKDWSQSYSCTIELNEC